ncbi:MAG: NifB/NifX family molybdenum-iron cluster-binding protein [Halodesulfovibrio sp.]
MTASAATHTTPQTVLLPVSARANTCIRFSGTAPGKAVLSPEQAVEMLSQKLAEGATIVAVDIAGPGDPLATPEVTLRTLSMVRALLPETPLSVTTNGMGAAALAMSLAEAGASRMNLLTNAVDPLITSGIYAWIRPGTRTLPLPEAACKLVEEQAAAVRACCNAGMKVGIRTTVFPETNDAHVTTIAATMAALGAEDMTLVPYSQGDADAPALPAPAEKLSATRMDELMDVIRSAAACHLPVFVDTAPATNFPTATAATGTGSGCTAPQQAQWTAPALPKPAAGKPNVALVSSNGMDVDMHLGQASKVLVYGPREDGLPCLLGVRKAPEAGSGDSRWAQLAELLHDCFVLLTASAGSKPKDILSRNGLPVLITEGEIDATVDLLYGGGKKGGKGKKRP